MIDLRVAWGLDPRPPEPRRRPWGSQVVVACAIAFLLAGTPGDGRADPRTPPLSISLDDGWDHKVFGKPTEYAPVTIGRKVYIRAIGRKSASGLYKDVDYELRKRPWIAWSWRVDRLQPSADLRSKKAEDFAAAVILLFGDARSGMRDLTALSYVWTNARIAAETVVESVHRPRNVRHLVIESGTARLGQGVEVRRNAAEDYRRAFGVEPPAMVRMVALWTDNDQTGEPVEAYYGPLTATSE